MIPIIKFRRIIPLLALLLFMISFSPPEQEGIEVMTFNIRYDNPDDGLFSWENRKDMVFWVIGKYNPDILGIQEALKEQMDDLDNALKDYKWSGVGRDDGNDKGEFVPIFYKKERFILADEGQFWLSETPEIPGSMGWDAACTRMVSWIQLKEKSSGAEYFVFNTHFDHVSEKARMKSAGLLSDSIRNIARQKPVIITGDLNCGPDSDPIIYLSRLFTDTRGQAKDEYLASATTFVGFPADVTRNQIIDHIFINQHFAVNEYGIIPDNANGFFPSDHLPVRVSLSLKMP